MGRARARPAGRPPAVARVLERMRATARTHEMLSPGTMVLVACSGGPDSICLLHALHLQRRLFRIRLAVFHFDHRLRPDSGADLAYVQGQAARLGLPFVPHAARDAPAKGESVEAWARLARYTALKEAAAEAGADLAALGHTLDDQAETVLLGLVRGGGIEAVAGMSPVATLPPEGFPAVRPLLDTTREEVRAFCGALRLRPRADPTNRDRRFLRNRVRAEVIPFLERTLDRNLRPTLARTAEHVRADAVFLEALALEAARGVVRVERDEVRLDTKVLAPLPRPLAVRVVRHALRLASALGGAEDVDLGAAHVHAVLDLVSAAPGKRSDLPGRFTASRSRGYVRVSRASPEAARRAPRRGANRREGGRA